MREGRNIKYLQGNYLNFKSDVRFDLITMIMCDYCALSPSQRQNLLGIWRDCIGKHGAVLLDVYSMAAYAEREEVSLCEKNQLDHFWHGDDYYAFVNTFKYDKEAAVLDKYTIVPEHSNPETIYNWLQYFSVSRLTEELTSFGFRIDQVLGNVAGDDFTDQSPEFTVVATNGT